MRAAVVAGYGPPDVVRVTDVPAPVLRAKEVLVRVVATAVTAGDARIRGGRFPRGFGVPARLALGLRGPRRPVLGMVFSDVVEAVGAEVADLVPGDEVCGMTGARMGAHAELVAVPAARAVRKPAEVTHEDAAGVLFGGTTALHFLRGVGRGATVLVNGASGAIGTNAVQLAKHAGAAVTAVTSGANADLVASLGADRVVDYTTTPEIPGRYDIVLDAVGTLSPSTGRRLLADGGVLLLAVATLAETVVPRRWVKAGVAPERVADVAFLLERVAKGELTVVVDEVVGLDGIVAAHRRVDSGRKVGNLVVRA